MWTPSKQLNEMHTESTNKDAAPFSLLIDRVLIEPVKTIHLCDILYLGTMNSSAFQKRKTSHRLVKAAANERVSTKNVSSSIKVRGVKGVAKGSRDKIRVPKKQSSFDSQRVQPEDRDASSCEERDVHDADSADDDSSFRCNITVLSNSQDEDTVAAPAAVEKKTKLPGLKKHKKKSKKSVSFHRYDEVIYRDVKEYVYSLHDVQVQEERANHDFVDDIEGVVGDVGYFFRCLKEGIQEEVSARRATKKPPVPKPRRRRGEHRGAAK
jgi:predicted DNA-binding ribbon-helix-helix protein